MTEGRKIRILLAKIGLDAHHIGIKYLARLLRDEGMEVIYLGLYQTPAKVVLPAIEEDVDVIGLSFQGGDHLSLVPLVLNLLKEKDVRIPLIVGGVIPREDIPVLKKMGVADVFDASTPVKTMIDSIKEIASPRK